MNARFLHPSARRNQDPAPAEAPVPDYADCCPAIAIVRVSMPAAEAGTQPADLLLCGHHYRASRRTLAEASAVVRGLPGTPSDIAAWVQVGQHAEPAAAHS